MAFCRSTVAFLLFFRHLFFMPSRRNLFSSLSFFLRMPFRGAKERALADYAQEGKAAEYSRPGSSSSSSSARDLENPARQRSRDPAQRNEPRSDRIGRGSSIFDRFGPFSAATAARLGRGPRFSGKLSK